MESELIFTNSVECEELFDEATTCLQENRNEEAIELFEQLLKKEPENIHALNGRGYGFMRLDCIDEALELFDKSLAIKDNVTAYMNKIIIYLKKEDYDTALNYCDKAIELYPESKDEFMHLRHSLVDRMFDLWMKPCILNPF